MKLLKILCLIILLPLLVNGQETVLGENKLELITEIIQYDSISRLERDLVLYIKNEGTDKQWIDKGVYVDGKMVSPSSVQEEDLSRKERRKRKGMEIYYIVDTLTERNESYIYEEYRTSLKMYGVKKNKTELLRTICNYRIVEGVSCISHLSIKTKEKVNALIEDASEIELIEIIKKFENPVLQYSCIMALRDKKIILSHIDKLSNEFIIKYTGRCNDHIQRFNKYIVNILNKEK